MTDVATTEDGVEEVRPGAGRTLREKAWSDYWLTASMGRRRFGRGEGQRARGAAGGEQESAEIPMLV